MKLLLKIQIALLILFSNYASAQVSINMSGLQFSTGESITNCGTIDLESRTSAQISCFIFLNKPSNLVVGFPSRVYIHRINSSTGQSIPLSSTLIPENVFNTSNYYQFTTNISLNASDVNATGDYIVASFQGPLIGPNYSCGYSIQKTPNPAFSISPTNISIPCGSTTPKTFTVNNIHNSSGTLSYQWNVGAGWATTTGTPVNGILTTTSNSLTLVPNTYPLSSISVAPILNGNTQSSLYTTLSSSFISSASIQGGQSTCSGSSIYTMNNLGANETVTWSLSNPSLATLSNASGNQVTLNVIGNGELQVIGTITNSCSQTTNKEIIIHVGAPFITNPLCPGNNILIHIDQLPLDNSQCNLCRSNYFYSDKNIIEAEATGGPNLTWEWEKLSTNFSWTTSQNKANFQPYQFGTIRFRVRASNGCGWSPWREQAINITENCTNENNQNFRMSENEISTIDAKTDFLKIYPNPSSSVVYVELANALDQPTNISAELFDFRGVFKRNIFIKNNRAKINVSDLPRGTYVLKISLDGKIESHQIIVE